MAYPHSRSETIADGSVHVLGVVASAIAGAVLLVYAVRWAGVPDAVAIGIYISTTLLAFIASAAYHLTPHDAARAVLRRIDHASIYFKIAGTYTPLAMLVGTVSAYLVLGVVWLLALVGAVAKLSVWRDPGHGSTLLYLGMGWMSVLLIWPLAQTVPGVSLGLIIAGGLTYSAGVLIYSREKMRFQNAVWHAIVLTASCFFFAAIAVGVTAAVA